MLHPPLPPSLPHAAPLSLTRRGLALGAAALAALPRPAAAQPSRNVLVGAFDFGPAGFQGNFNPLTATGGFSALNFIYEPLLLYTPLSDRLEGALAASWAVNAEKTRYTVTLADNVHWQDGQKFSSADVLFTLALAQDSKTGSVFAARLAGITATAPDAKTVVFTLPTPELSLPNLLAKLMILPRHALEPLGRDGLAHHPWWTKAPIGTGPFQLAHYEPGRYVVYKPFPGYRLGKPRLEGLINRYFDDGPSVVAALHTGEISFSYVDAEAACGFAHSKDFRVLSGPSAMLAYLGFNGDAGFAADVRIRQAFLHAIDRAGIVRSLFRGTAEVVESLFLAPALTPADLVPYAYDPQRARALLAAAGWEKSNGGKPLLWLTCDQTALVAKAMAAMQGQLAAVGIKVLPRAVDTATYNDLLLAPKPDPSTCPLLYANGQNGPDPAEVALWTAESEIPPGGINVARIRDGTLNAALAQALSEVDAPKRESAWQTVAKVVNRDLPLAPLWVAQGFGVVTANVKNFVWQPASGPFAQHAELWSFG